MNCEAQTAHYGDYWCGVDDDMAWDCNNDPGWWCDELCWYCGNLAAEYAYCDIDCPVVPEYYGCNENTWCQVDIICRCIT